MSERQAALATAWVLLSLMAWHIATIQWIDLPLFFDEAHYLHWSYELDWGYFSKPPMIALLIRLTTGLFGMEEWAVKLSSPVLYTATAFLVWRMGREWFHPRAGRWAALLFASMPLVGFNSLFVTTDAPLLFFWALTAWLFQRALQAPEKHHRWLLAGLAGGLGMLSKYSMILLPASLFLWLLLEPDRRRQLLRPGFWLAVLTAFVVFLPNLWWNWQNQFISFQHTAEISQLDRQWFHPQRFVEFILGQVLVVGPVTAWMGLHAWRRRRELPERMGTSLSLAGWLAWPTWALLAGLALLSRANLNWAAPATIGFALLAGAGWHLLGLQRRWLVFSLLFNLTLLTTFHHWPDLVRASGYPLTSRNDPYQRLRGWPELGRAAGQLLRRHPEAGLLADDRKTLAWLGYYGLPEAKRFAYYNRTGCVRNQYDLRHDLLRQTERHPGDSWLLFTRNPDLSALKRDFTRVEPLGAIRARPYPDREMRLCVIRLQGPRPHPANSTPGGLCRPETQARTRRPYPERCPGEPMTGATEP